MKCLVTGFEYVREMGVLGFLLAPFLIWSVVETVLVGFFYPSVEALRNRSKEEPQIDNGWKYAWDLGRRRAVAYNWEIFFASLSGVVILDIYWMILGLTTNCLPSFLYVIILALTGFMLVSLFFSKAYGIMSKPPSSPLRSMRYIWGGFINPFDKRKASGVVEMVNEVNENLMNSRGKVST